MGWVVPVIQLATAAYGAYSSKKAGDKALKSQKGLLQDQRDYQKNLAWWMNRGKAGADQAMRYYSGLLSGNRQRMTEQLGPELDQINQGYDSAREQMMLQPRGGGRATAMTDQIFKRQQDINDAFIGGRRNAADKLFGQGMGMAGIGAGQGAAMGGISNTLGNMWNMGQQQGQDAQGFGSAITGGFEGLWDWYQNRGTGTPSTGGWGAAKAAPTYQYTPPTTPGAGMAGFGASPALGAAPSAMPFFRSAIPQAEDQPDRSAFRSSLLLGGNQKRRRPPSLIDVEAY